ncbi:MAG: hypothetical protein U0893_08475 [Chloroflexota bacterium]
MSGRGPASRGPRSSRWWGWALLLALVAWVGLGPSGAGPALVRDAIGLGGLVPGDGVVAAAPAEQAGCTPRPPVHISTTGDTVAHVLNVAVSAGSGVVQRIQFNQPSNAIITVPGLPPITGTASITPNTATVTFTVQQANGQLAVQVPMVVTDGCGAWPTFVGGGASWASPPGGSIVFRDQFVGNQSPPLPATLPANPGPGSWHLTDVEGQIKKLGGRLRGLTQPASPVWGEAKIVGPGFSRLGGRAYAAVITLEDQNAPLVAGWDVASGGTADPRNVGHSIVFDTSNLGVSIPGREVLVNSQTGATGASARPIQYLVVVVLGDVGATYWISTFDQMTGGLEGDGDRVGIPAWPQMRLLWVDGGATAGTTGTLFPIVSGNRDGNGVMPPYSYVNGHGVEDLRVIDLPAPWSSPDGLASLADRFTRGPAASLGGPWAAQSGSWSIAADNRAATTSTSGTLVAWANGGQADGLFQWDVTVPSTFNGSNAGFGAVVRRADANNYLRVWNNLANQLVLQTWKNGAFGTTLYSQAFTWTPGSTNRLTVLAKGNTYLIFINGQVVNSGNWIVDSGNNFLTATGFGLYGLGTGDAAMTGARWDNVAAYPFVVSGPSIVGQGAVTAPFQAGAQVAQDTFTGANGTQLLNHTAEQGGPWSSFTFPTGSGVNWTLSGNHLNGALVGAPSATAQNVIVQNVGTTDLEASVKITPNAALSPTNGVMRSGIAVRWTDIQNHVLVRLYKDPLQQGSDEIELIETVGGQSRVQHKVNVGPKYVGGQAVTLTVQAKGDVIRVFLDGEPRIAFITTVLGGTRAGLHRPDVDSASGSGTNDACTFDDWVVKAL